ncbi:Signal transduction histidine kinase [Ekhidna lutea]|uniref:histidine kinase n=1 Tax=Ekhidna lutea TaxID=447679 RepID=A0A239LAS9_EKHLU|nr:sensor histidine kinase [Ekhidna lutea]SNT27072.1 Signal transduction histidine kinase [Ekhidna lutea]
MIAKTSLYISLFLALGISYSQGQPLAFNGQQIELDGSWNLVMDDFLSYDEISQRPKSISINVPSIWNEVLWEGSKVGAYGFGTYYRTFIYPQNLRDTTLAIEVSEVSLAYKLYANEKLIGQVGNPGADKNKAEPRIDYQIFDFSVQAGDTITLIFHISNFEHKTGGLWYAPTIDYETRIINRYEQGRTIKLIILGCILIGGLFQFTIFILNPREKFCIYFALVCMSLSLIIITRGDLTIMDLFPDTSWITLKKTLYLAIAMTGPANALFLREIYPKFYPTKIINIMAIIAIALVLFVIVVHPRITYSIVPLLHGYNIIIGVFLLVCLVRAAIARKYGARFLLIGYAAVFLTLVHDMLSSQYILPSYSFELMYLGITIYIIQLMILLSGRYLFALKGKEELSNHLKKVNKELEEMVERRTKALKDKNQIIETKNAELQKAIKEKDHLMAVVAHDLKAPLSSIQGISEMMGTDLEGQSAQFNEMIKKVTMDGRAMIENLTELKVFEQGDYEVKLLSIDIGDFFDQKKMEYNARAEKKDIVLKSHLISKQKIVTTDVNILGRITDNLLSNAIKFTPKGGEVNFNINANEESLTLVFKDNGPGFKENDKDKVFKKFQRLSARPTAGESSTGLGLSIVKTLVKLLNGTIALESEEGNGATFTVTLPV